jgi:hypothetical protein
MTAETLTAAALQGAILAVVKAAVDRAGAVGVRKATGQWPRLTDRADRQERHHTAD